MTIVAVHIVKSTTWRGEEEEWENTYHYDVPSGQTEGSWASLAGLIAGIEKTFHDSTATWKRFLINGPTDGTEEENVMITAGDLSGVGSISSGTIMPKEMSIVTQLYMGRSGAPFHRKTFLRKYWHVGRLSPAGTGDDALGNGPLSTAQKSFYAGKMDSLKTIAGWTAVADLCKPDGTHIPGGTAAVCLPYAHTRQFRR